IKKTVAAFLKILHPSGLPSDEEFEEYVAYAVEARRRVKEQMNKRKSDDEFAKINLSYINANGQEIIVYCPESRLAPATQDPVRRDIHGDDETVVIETPVAEIPDKGSVFDDVLKKTAVPTESVNAEPEAQLQEQHFTIHYGATGYSYESIISPYLEGAKSIEIEDPYIRLTHQIQNFVRFCEAVIKTPSVKTIRLITSYDDDTDVMEMSDRLGELKQSLLEMDIELDLKVNKHMHDREIRIDNGWIVKIGRGLDFFQKPDSWYSIGTNDLMLRKCLETKVDIFKKG
ncbi:BREX system Lon protease-like protein BrxL, partial [Endozoicomonas sp. ONNA2]|uniref:BREX system Lon protease-like protein BrxL n=1 Tax=Endozoicomonas sp. ONNA2 TaxID=2828741 RepID=UPI0021473E05